MRCDLRSRPEHEISFAKGGVRNGKIRRMPCAATPQNDIEIKRPGPPPGPAALPSELRLHRLQPSQHDRRSTLGLHDDNGVGIAAQRRPDRIARHHARHSNHVMPILAQSQSGSAQNPARTADPRHAHVRAESQQIAVDRIGVHGAQE